MKRRRAPSLRTLFRSHIELEAPKDGEGKNPRWIQIARTGLWKGYRINRTIEFTVDTFSKIIENFHAHPTYQKAADGKGTTDVIPFDFNHASEMDPSEGDLAVNGAPAQAWVQELEMRPGPDGKTGLWAFTRLLEPVLTYIKDSKIKWTSVTVWPNAVDPESGKEIGPLLTSVAFTNQPFIEGMQPIAASYSGPGGMWYDRARDAEDALAQLRCVFGLPQTASAADVLGEIGKFQAWVRTGSVPYGVDADELVGCMRAILGLPALSTPDEVFAEMDKLLPALIEQDALEATESAAADGSNLQEQIGSASVTPDSNQPLTTRKNEAMDAKLLMTLATAFGIAATTEEAIIAAAQDAKNSRTQLSKLYTAIGATDENTAAVRLTSLVKAEKDLSELQPKYTAAQKRLDEFEAQEAEGEVTLAIEQHKLPESIKPVLLDYRRRNLDEFRRQYPITAPDKQHLTRVLFATSEGGQLGSTRTGAGSRGTSQLGGEDTLLSKVEAYPGRNRIEKCMSFIRATVQGADKWTHEDVHAQACEMNKKFPRVA